MPSVVLSVRTSDTERASWAEAAEGQGVSVNYWARRALNEQAALDAALRKQEPPNSEGDTANG